MFNHMEFIQEVRGVRLAPQNPTSQYPFSPSEQRLHVNKHLGYLTLEEFEG